MKLSVSKTTHYHSFSGCYSTVSSCIDYGVYFGEDFLNVRIDTKKQNNIGLYSVGYSGRLNNRPFRSKKEKVFSDYETAWRVAWQKLMLWR